MTNSTIVISRAAGEYLARSLEKCQDQVCGWVREDLLAALATTAQAKQEEKVEEPDFGGVHINYGNAQRVGTTEFSSRGTPR